MLDDFIKSVLKYDIRGPFVDTIFAIKEKRDLLIKKIIEDGEHDFEDDL